jgi:predicted transcriptional regulator
MYALYDIATVSSSKTVSLRVPEDLLSKIDRLAQEKYKSHKGVPNRSLGEHPRFAMSKSTQAIASLR